MKFYYVYFRANRNYSSRDFWALYREDLLFAWAEGEGHSAQIILRLLGYEVIHEIYDIHPELCVYERIPKSYAELKRSNQEYFEQDRREREDKTNIIQINIGKDDASRDRIFHITKKEALKLRDELIKQDLG